MELILVGYIAAGLLGLTFGSFAGATVWRLRARQVVSDESEYKVLKAKDKLSLDERAELEWLKSTKAERQADSKRLKPLAGTRLSKDRSRCLHCHHELAWYDLLPLASWLSTGGKCRYCKKAIGTFEPFMEIATAVLFVLMYHYVVLPSNSVFTAIFWLITTVLLVILTAYDRKWFLLPDRVVFPLITLALGYAAYSVAISNNLASVLSNIVMSVAILSGLYFLLWVLSRGRLVGFGDIKLGLALGLLLMDWRWAVLTLFLANLIGMLVVLPGLLTRRLSRETQIPFGPFLVLGFFIALFWGQSIIEGYNLASIWLTNILLML